jgi:hypothetical protein
LDRRAEASPQDHLDTPLKLDVKDASQFELSVNLLGKAACQILPTVVADDVLRALKMTTREKINMRRFVQLMVGYTAFEVANKKVGEYDRDEPRLKGATSKGTMDEIESLRFAPRINPQSEKIISQRESRDVVIRFKQKMQNAAKRRVEMERLSRQEAVEKEMAECTFKPAPRRPVSTKSHQHHKEVSPQTHTSHVIKEALQMEHELHRHLASHEVILTPQDIQDVLPRQHLSAPPPLFEPDRRAMIPTASRGMRSQSAQHPNGRYRDVISERQAFGGPGALTEYGVQLMREQIHERARQRHI